MKFTQTAAIAAFIACANATDPAPAAPVAAKCTVGKLEAFTDDKCTKAAKTEKAVADKVKVVEDAFKKSATDFKAKCNADGDNFKTAVCDGTGFGTQYFKDDKCATALATATDA